jgi:polar amino acid transport system substrate-binding protein
MDQTQHGASEPREIPGSELNPAARRDFLRRAGLALGVGIAATACTSGKKSSSSAAAGSGDGQAGESLLDRITRTKKARLGVDLTFPPLQFKDPANGNKPAGYSVDLAVSMLKDLGAEPEFVEVPFAQLFAAQAAGRFDFSGIAATILPSRAQRVLFASEPLFIESEVILLKPNFKISSPQDLNKAEVTLAVQLGSSQEATAPLLFPNAKLKSLENQPAIQDVASGRSDAMLLSEFNIKEALDKNRGLTVFQGPPVFVDYNTFFMPTGDARFKDWVDNWIRYQTSHGVLEGLWNKYVGDNARKIGLPSIAIRSPFIPTQLQQG